MVSDFKRIPGSHNKQVYNLTMTKAQQEKFQSSTEPHGHYEDLQKGPWARKVRWQYVTMRGFAFNSSMSNAPKG